MCAELVSILIKVFADNLLKNVFLSFYLFWHSNNQ